MMNAMNWFCFSITSAIVAELIPAVLGHSKVVSLGLGFFFFFCYCFIFLTMVVGLKTELGQFLHFMCCTAEQLFWLRSSSAEGWALLRLVLSQNMY